MSSQYPFLVVRTQFHGGGIASRHRTREAAEKAADRYQAQVAVVTAEEYEQLRECGECKSPYSLCK